MFPLHTGTAGRSVMVDASGRIIGTTDPIGGLYVFEYGNTGRFDVIDASGRFVLSPESEVTGIVGGGNVHAASGVFNGTLEVDETLFTPVKIVTASGSKEINFGAGNVFRVGLLATTAFAFVNPKSGAKYTLLMNQDIGGASATWPGNVVWQSGSAPILTSASGARDVVNLLYDDNDNIFYGDFWLDFS